MTIHTANATLATLLGLLTVLFGGVGLGAIMLTLGVLGLYCERRLG